MIKKSERLLRQPWRTLNVRNTEDGPEKLCSRCTDWWPLDETCFSWISTEERFSSICKACDADKQRDYRAKKACPNLISDGTIHTVPSMA